VLFAGFPPPKSAARRTFLEELAGVRATLIVFEGGSRLAESLADMAAVLGPQRPACVCRELTKLYETVARGSLAELAADPRFVAPKGEIVVLVGPGREEAASAEDADAALAEALSRLKPADAAAEVAKALGLPRRDLYRRALELKGGA
jgi:16S rRNA (cytidine1402-2'-O)-methyltransferase